MKKYLDSDKFWWLMLAILIIVQATVTAIMFANLKTDYHSDEIWNYGFANSSDGMHIYKDKEKNLRYDQEWVDAQVLKDYITVSEDEIFDYASAYDNASHDLNPFLGYFFLHFICSLFPGVWSPWFGFALNIICFAITQIFLFKLVKCSTKSNVFAFIACFFLGFSSGMRDVTVFLRIYAPAVTFTTMMAYYMAVIFQKRDEQVKKSVYVKLLLSTLGGCLTLHTFLIVAFAMTALYCLYYLFTGRFKKFFALGFLMAGAVGLSMIVFPSTYMHLFGDKQVDTVAVGALEFGLQFRAYFVYLTTDFFGIHTSAWHTMTGTYIMYAVLLLLFLLIPVCFILRNETYFKNFVKKLKDGIISLWHKKNNFPFDIIVMTGALLLLFVICGLRTSVYFMGRFSSRYIFIIYPIFVAILAEALYHILKLIFKEKNRWPVIIVSVLALTFTILNNALSNRTFFIESSQSGLKITEIEDNANVIVVMDDIVRMTSICAKLNHVDNYYYVTYDTALENNYEMTDNMDKDAPLYLLVDEEKMVVLSDLKFETELDEENFWNMYNNKMYYDKEKYLEYFEALPMVSKVEYVGFDVMFGRGISIYRLN
ncbi:MAG: hypothetical protein ACI4EV_02630 [Lachnospiraceae bacterium]